MAKCELESKTCRVIFRPENDHFFSGTSISVKSDDAVWASNLFSELEEQVDRTILRDQVSKYRQSKLFRRFTPLVILLAFTLALLGFMVRTIGRLTASESVFAELSGKAKSAQSMEDKIDFVFEYSRYTFGKNQSFSNSGFPFSLDSISLPFIIGVSPFVLVGALAIFALTTCYPGSVFLWGDYADHYKALVDRRSKIWNVVVIALLVGLLINLSSAVISRGIGI